MSTRNPFDRRRPPAETSSQDAARILLGKTGEKIMRSFGRGKRGMGKSGMSQEEAELGISADERASLEKSRRMLRYLNEAKQLINNPESPMRELLNTISFVEIVEPAGIDVEELLLRAKALTATKELGADIQASARFNVARMLHHIHRTEEGLAFIERDRFSPAHDQTLCELIETEAELGKYVQAKESLDFIYDPVRRRLLLLAIAKAQALAGDQTGALKEFLQVKREVADEMKPLDRVTAFTDLLRIMVESGIQPGRLLNGVTLQVKNLRSQGFAPSPEILKNLASAHLGLGELEIAEKYMGFYLKKGGSNQEFFREFVDVLEKRGHHERAKQLLETLSLGGINRFFLSGLFARIHEGGRAEELLVTAEEALSDESEMRYDLDKRIIARAEIAALLSRQLQQEQKAL